MAGTKEVKDKLHRRLSSARKDGGRNPGSGKFFQSLPKLPKPDQFNAEGSIKQEIMTKELLKRRTKPASKTIEELK